MVDDDLERIRSFWDAQAHALGSDPRATTPDHWIRDVEIRAISRVLESFPSSIRVLDIGCGNGYSTLALAAAHPIHQFVGGDYSSVMIDQAVAGLDARPELAGRVAFRLTDVLSIGADAEYDVIISDRCLINLPSFELQRRAVDQIAGALQPGGTYVAIENFAGPQASLNEERIAIGLEPIAIRWHNLYLDEADFVGYCSGKFEVAEIAPITSTYYLVTRLVYSKLCQLDGVEPGYDHPIYEIASKLPSVGDLGPVKLLRFTKRSPS